MSIRLDRRNRQRERKCTCSRAELMQGRIHRHRRIRSRGDLPTENGLREGEGEYHYSEEVWQKGVWRGNKQTVWKGVYSFSGRFDNAKRLFDVEKGWFPFAFEAEVNLGLLLDPAKT